MGPQLDSCGRPDTQDVPLGLANFASMGPQLDSCGRSGSRTATGPSSGLQWGRNLTVAEGIELAKLEIGGRGGFNGAAT